MEDDEDRVFTRILKSLEIQMRDGDACRIVALCRQDFAIRLAERLRGGVIILLRSNPSELSFSPEPVMSNLEVLRCDLSSAHFLPGSVSAVVALDLEAETWMCNQNLQMVAEWLQPGGLFCLVKSPGSLWKKWRSRLTGSKSDLIHLASSVGLQGEEPQLPRLQIWRKL